MRVPTAAGTPVGLPAKTRPKTGTRTGTNSRSPPSSPPRITCPPASASAIATNPEPGVSARALSGLDTRARLGSHADRHWLTPMVTEDGARACSRGHDRDVGAIRALPVGAVLEPRLGEYATQQPRHRVVIALDQRAQTRDSPLAGRLDQQLEQPAPDPLALVGVVHGDGELGLGRTVVVADESSHRDEPVGQIPFGGDQREVVGARRRSVRTRACVDWSGRGPWSRELVGAIGRVSGPRSRSECGRLDGSGGSRRPSAARL